MDIVIKKIFRLFIVSVVSSVLAKATHTLMRMSSQRNNQRTERDVNMDRALKESEEASNRVQKTLAAVSYRHS